MAAQLLDVPNEILVTILSKLNPRDLLRCAGSCTRLRSLILQSSHFKIDVILSLGDRWGSWMDRAPFYLDTSIQFYLSKLLDESTLRLKVQFETEDPDRRSPLWNFIFASLRYLGLRQWARGEFVQLNRVVSLGNACCLSCPKMLLPPRVEELVLDPVPDGVDEDLWKFLRNKYKCLKKVIKSFHETATRERRREIVVDLFRSFCENGSFQIHFVRFFSSGNVDVKTFEPGGQGNFQLVLEEDKTIDRAIVQQFAEQEKIVLKVYLQD